MGSVVYSFKFIGDILMILSRGVTLKKIKSFNSVNGLSLKTQILYLLIYILRYLDLFQFYIFMDTPLSIYNNILKILFISYQFYIVYKILINRNSYNRDQDSFPISTVIIFGFVVSYFLTRDLLVHRFMEFCYSYSLILESVAILPQLVMTQAIGECEKMTALYIILLGTYRISYLVHFFIKKVFLRLKIDNLMLVTSLIQAFLYGDFIVTYLKYLVSNRSITSFNSNKQIF